MKKIFLYIILPLIWGAAPLHAQLEAAHWYFGERAGLDFLTNPVSADISGQLNTIEGCSSISDIQGNLLFYTDGVTVYNRNHTVMANGTGLNGDPSSSQSGLIVPKPGDSNIYYIITVDDIGNYGLRYSEVNMAANSGLGRVNSLRKNVPLIENVKEKVTAIANLSQNFVWVITVGPAPTNSNPSIPVNTYLSPYNTIYAVKIDSSGLNNYSQVVYTTFNGSGGTQALNISSLNGYIKISPTGNKIAIANYYDGTLYLCDFDINTGRASNLTQFPAPTSNFYPYGIEFSPNGELLYVLSCDSGSTSGGTRRIYQIDLTNGNATQQIDAHSGYRGALQLGIDGKIYVTESYNYDTGRPFLSTIENPDLLGTGCNFQYNSVNLNGRNSRQGLPQFIQSFFVQIATNNICVGDTAHFSVQSNIDIDHVDWVFGDGNSATTQPDPSDLKTAEANHVYNQDGNFTVSATIYTTNNNNSTITTNITIYPLPEIQNNLQIETCDIDQNGIQSFNLHAYDINIIGIQSYQGTYTAHYYETQTDGENHTNEIQDPYTNTTPYNQEIYVVIVNEDTGCENMGTVELVVNPLPDINQVPPLETCDDNDDGLAQFNLNEALPDILNGRDSLAYPVVYYETQADAENQTHPLSSSYTNTTPYQQTVYYTITDTVTGCINYGNFDLIVHPIPEINMDDDYIFCRNDSVYVEAPSGFVQYDWSTGETGQGIYVSQEGQYTVTVTDQHTCSNSKTVSVYESAPAEIDTVYTTDFNGNNNSITIIVSGPGDYEYSLDGINYQDSNTFDGLQAGTYTVYVRDKNGCGISTQEVFIMGIMPFFTPNGDGRNDFWQVINIQLAPESKVYIYDRFGKLMTAFNGTSPGWDGTYNGVPQPSDDYWYIIELPESRGGKTVKGHFSLIR